MKSLSILGLGLSLVFGCLLLTLAAELYYLLWWKKRITNRDLEDGHRTTTREFFYMFCRKKPPSLRSNTLNPQDFCSSGTQVQEPEFQLHGNSNKEFWHSPFGESSVEAELMRLQTFSGPPRFLFTIKEETREDLESEDGKSRDRSRKGSRSRSLSDVLHLMETPYLTPIASPPYFTPPLTPVKSSHNQNVFNSFFGSASEAEFHWLSSSPPSKFQFLKDAEDELYSKKLAEEAEVCGHKMDEFDHFKSTEIPSTSVFLKDEENGSFLTSCVAKNREAVLDSVQHQSVLHCTFNSSQVLPLASSPPESKLTSSSNTIMHQKLHQIN